MWQQGDAKHVTWDDQRLTALEPVNAYDYGQLPEGLNIEIYEAAYELHAANPEEVILAGGVYVWGGGWESNVGSLRVYMASLRKKLEGASGSPQYIQTHIGIGYRMLKIEDAF